MIKHTPGPWERAVMFAGNLGVRASGGYICGLTRPSYYAGQEKRYAAEIETMEADARLIAAAPDMRYALTVLIQAAEDERTSAPYAMRLVGMDRALEVARAAIAKAEGNA